MAVGALMPDGEGLGFPGRKAGLRFSLRFDQKVKDCRERRIIHLGEMVWEEWKKNWEGNKGSSQTIRLKRDGNWIWENGNPKSAVQIHEITHLLHSIPLSPAGDEIWKGRDLRSLVTPGRKVPAGTKKQWLCSQAEKSRGLFGGRWKGGWGRKRSRSITWVDQIRPQN